ncbi:MAG: phosphatidylglycerophosphatase A [Phycisphaerales bacterium]|jgi:phosphatidylglycerophosphatase A|nr:phosphatidylglycerophosphatase A [Phycisphaerales bacterium]MDP6889762.1 phosphatidylglycerophosphatase A [Phycisphaerales bacterium]
MSRLLFVTAGGLGLLRPAPGTWGSLPPAVAAAVLGTLGGEGVAITMAALLVAGILVSLLLAPWFEQHFGRQDPPQVVCDEIAGMSLCLLLLPWPPLAGQSPWWSVALACIALILFRGFDIAKPPPIEQSQHLPGGWGVLVDDLLAGLAAAAVCWGLILLAR